MTRRLFINHRRAFTLVEALVGFAVIGLLIALLLPAVQAAREAGRRVHCMNNLRQLGIALATYDSAMGTLPPPTQRSSVHARILPYLDQGTLANFIDHGDTDGAFQNSTASRTQVAVFLCPSDDGLSRDPGWNNYPANLGLPTPSDPFNGAFGPRVALRDFVDGTSQTVAFSEWVLGSRGYPPARSPRRNVLMVPTYDIDFYRFAAKCDALDPHLAELDGAVIGRGWDEGIPTTTLYNHYLSVNRNSCMNGGYRVLSAGSWHPGGANVLFADGHVQFVEDSMTLETWRALGTRAGGEVVSATQL